MPRVEQPLGLVGPPSLAVQGLLPTYIAAAAAAAAAGWGQAAAGSEAAAKNPLHAYMQQLGVELLLRQQQQQQQALVLQQQQQRQRQRQRQLCTGHREKCESCEESEGPDDAEEGYHSFSDAPRGRTPLLQHTRLRQLAGFDSDAGGAAGGGAAGEHCAGHSNSEASDVWIGAAPPALSDCSTGGVAMEGGDLHAEDDASTVAVFLLNMRHGTRPHAHVEQGGGRCGASAPAEGPGASTSAALTLASAPAPVPAAEAPGASAGAASAAADGKPQMSSDGAGVTGAAGGGKESCSAGQRWGTGLGAAAPVSNVVSNNVAAHLEGQQQAVVPVETCVLKHVVKAEEASGGALAMPVAALVPPGACGLRLAQGDEAAREAGAAGSVLGVGSLPTPWPPFLHASPEEVRATESGPRSQSLGHACVQESNIVGRFAGISPCILAAPEWPG